ncbi:MAG: urate hydroxylase PuuD [Sulfuricaulis sp.]|nr:urate hydroxylase PuuD [Sulfuricaulis sp.]
MELIIARWLHIFAGIVWIGLLYYFNFVQAVALPKAKADNTAAGITKHIAPQALLWFRWAALATWLLGAYYLERSGIGLGNTFMLKGTAASIGIGAWLGTIMLFNVWVLIWPNQKKVLGLVQADDATKAKAARVAFLASRTNTMLSIPMLFFMVAGSAAHGLPHL